MGSSSPNKVAYRFLSSINPLRISWGAGYSRCKIQGWAFPRIALNIFLSHFRSSTHRRIADLVALDFYSITDHGLHMSHFDWFLNRILCDLNEGVRGMTTLLGLEYSNRNFGHQNVIYDSCDGQLYSRNSQMTPESLWSLLSVGHTITIPHHTAAASDSLDYDLRHFNADFNRLYEIYQARGSYECYDCIGGR